MTEVYPVAFQLDLRPISQKNNACLVLFLVIRLCLGEDIRPTREVITIVLINRHAVLIKLPSKRPLVSTSLRAQDILRQNSMPIIEASLF